MIGRLEEYRAHDVLRVAKHKGFRSMSGSFSPSMGLHRVWGLVGAFLGKRTSRTNVSNDPGAQEFVELQNDLVMEDIPPIPRFLISTRVTLIEFGDGDFLMALTKCRKEFSPGLDLMGLYGTYGTLSYETIQRLPPEGLELVRSLFNDFFVSSTFPEDWIRVFVKFIPKSGGKGYRPILLTSALGKLMERLVHFGLEHFIEHRRLIPPDQFGFTKS